MANLILSIVVCIVVVVAAPTTVECGGRTFGFLGAQVGPCGPSTVGLYVPELCTRNNLPCFECKCILVSAVLSPLYLLDYADCRLASAGQFSRQGHLSGPRV